MILRAIYFATPDIKPDRLSLQSNLKERFQRRSVQERTVQAAEMNFRIVNDDGCSSAAMSVTKYLEIVKAACSGTAVVNERLGDQVGIVADESADLILTARQIALRTYEEHHLLSIHAAIHFGPVFIQENTFFGSTINVASRIMNITSRGQVLCSASFSISRSCVLKVTV